MAAFRIAHLEADQVEVITDLETEMDLCLIALEPGLEVAQLNEEQLTRVRGVEKELGVTLIAYREC